MKKEFDARRRELNIRRRIASFLRKIKEKVGVPARFFIFTLIFTLILFLINPALVIKAVPLFLKTVGQIWIVLIIVFALLFLFNLLITPKLVKQWLGHASGLKGWLIAIIGGILSSGPIYLWYPLLADLEEHGMRPALAATFLYNRSVKIPLLPLLISYFGLPFTITILSYTIIFSVIQGWIVEFFVNKKKDIKNLKT